MNKNPIQQIIPGISLSQSGQATVEPDLTEVLIEIAIKIDDVSQYAVDVEHVVAAIILAVQSESMGSETDLSSDHETLIPVLADLVETVFKKFDGKVGEDD